MPTECNPMLFEFAPVEGRAVVAAFDGGAITSDAGSLLLGATDRTIGLLDGFAACFSDQRCAELVEHEVRTLVGQRVFGIALGYEDLNDHDQLRHDPMMAVLAGKLEARRSDCAPVAGKSTLNRLELSGVLPSKYHRISHDAAAIERLFVDVFLDAHRKAPRQIILDIDATDDPLHGRQEGRFFNGARLCSDNQDDILIVATQAHRLAQHHLFEDRAPLCRGADLRMTPATVPWRLFSGCRRPAIVLGPRWASGEFRDIPGPTLHVLMPWGAGRGRLCRLDLATPIPRSCATSRGTVTCP
jgi:hypothetical protein